MRVGLTVLGLGLAWALGCAEITKPRATPTEVEAVQVAAVQRHPHQSWALERVTRVFLRELATLPQVHGRTYPFLGFDWWVTAAGRVMVENVTYPSPAKDAELRHDLGSLPERGLRQGDIVLGVNNWPLYPWLPKWDRYFRYSQNLFKYLQASGEIRRVFGEDFIYRSKKYLYGDLDFNRSLLPRGDLYLSAPPGELLMALLLDMRHLAMETRRQYLTGPVEIQIERDGQRYRTTLYPQHLPAEYAVMVATDRREITAWAAPGRIILSHRLVSFCRTDDELAIIIGRELAHHALGHLVRRAGQRQVGEAVGRLLSGLATFHVNRLLDLRDYLVYPAYVGQGQDVVVSIFSQGDEREADAYGLWYAYQAGFNIDQGLEVYERLAAVRSDPFKQTEFLDTHPASLERLARMRLLADYFKSGRAAEVFLQAPTLNRRASAGPSRVQTNSSSTW